MAEIYEVLCFIEVEYINLQTGFWEFFIFCFLGK